MISRELSIKKPSDFYRLKKDGLSIKSNNFQLKYIKSDSEFKVSIIVSKIISPISPKRNKLKRIYKSLINDSKFNKKILLIVYPKITSLNVKYSELKVEFLSALDKIKY
jgi:ribonuclease P protein component